MTIEQEAIQEPELDEETKQILDDLREENPEEPEKEPEETEEVEEVEEKSEDDQEETPESPEEEDKPNRAPKMMPAWQYEKEKKRWEKEKNELLEKVSKTTQEPEKKEVPQSVKSLAEKYGVDEDFASDLLDVVKNSVSPIQDSEILETIKEFKKNQEEIKLNQSFDREFEKTLSVIKGEYPEISDTNLSAIKVKLKDLAFSEQYAKTPLSVIYKGLDDFRDFTVSKKKSVESSKRQAPSEEFTDYENLTEDDLAKMNGAELDKYFAWIEKKG